MSKMVVEKYGETKEHYTHRGIDDPLFVIHAVSPEEMRTIMVALNEYKKKTAKNTDFLEKSLDDGRFSTIVLEQQKAFSNHVKNLADSFTSQFSHYPEFSCGSDA